MNKSVKAAVSLLLLSCLAFPLVGCTRQSEESVIYIDSFSPDTISVPSANMSSDTDFSSAFGE